MVKNSCYRDRNSIKYDNDVRNTLNKIFLFKIIVRGNSREDATRGKMLLCL